MIPKRTYDREGHAHFVTSSCFHRRRLLDHDRAKKAVLGVLNSQLASQGGQCVGFVLMPDHVHAIVQLSDPDQIGRFMKQWKQRSSVQIKRLLSGTLSSYGAVIDLEEPVWQAGYYDFNLFSPSKVREKLHYIHENPVRAGLVEHSCDWAWSSARFYEQGLDVGVPIAPLD